MLPLPDDICSSDVGQWLYGGVAVWKQEDGECVPVVLRVAHGHSQTAVCSSLRTDEDALGTVEIPFSQLYGHWPICGSINIPEVKLAIHVERVQQRQYRRTFNDRQVRYLVPRAWEARLRLPRQDLNLVRTSSPAVARALMAPDYPSVDAAFHMLSTGWLTVAINPRVIIACDAVGKRLVYYRGKVAASIVEGTLRPIADVTTCKLIARALGEEYSICSE